MRQDARAAPRRVARVGDHQPRVVGAAVGIDETVAIAVLQAVVIRAAIEPHRGRMRQPCIPMVAAQMVVEEQAGADHPARAQPGHVGHHEARRPDQVRRHAQQRFAFRQGLGHQAELVLFEIAQAAMDQLRGTRRGGAGQVAAFHQGHRETAARGVARDAGAVDAAADDQQIDGKSGWRHLGRHGSACYAVSPAPTLTIRAANPLPSEWHYSDGCRGAGGGRMVFANNPNQNGIDRKNGGPQWM